VLAKRKEFLYIQKVRAVFILICKVNYYVSVAMVYIGEVNPCINICIDSVNWHSVN